MHNQCDLESSEKCRAAFPSSAKESKTDKLWPLHSSSTLKYPRRATMRAFLSTCTFQVFRTAEDLISLLITGFPSMFLGSWTVGGGPWMTTKRGFLLGRYSGFERFCILKMRRSLLIQPRAMFTSRSSSWDQHVRVHADIERPSPSKSEAEVA